MIYVIGLHHLEDLGPRLRELISRAEVLAGGKRHLALLASHPAEKILLSPLEKALGEIRKKKEARVVILTSGDPLFFGLGRRLLEEFPPEDLVFYPAPTAMQLAFARLRLSWEDARFISFHGRSPQNVHLEIAPYQKVAFFTDPQNTPSRIASYLLEKGISGKAFVCENLGLAEERIVGLPLEEVRGKRFSALNLMVLLKEAQPRRLLFGLPEEHYQHERGLITKAEVRAVVISALAPFPEATVWDLGAGSGAVGLELAGLAFRGQTFLVEKEASRVKLLRKNLFLTKLDNVEIIESSIKEALPSLPSPDLIFVGGGFGDLIEEASSFLRSLKKDTRLVATFVVFEHLLKALDFCQTLGFKTSFSALFLARGKVFPDGGRGLLSQNPVFILKAWRQR